MNVNQINATQIATLRFYSSHALPSITAAPPAISFEDCAELIAAKLLRPWSNLYETTETGEKALLAVNWKRIENAIDKLNVSSSEAREIRIEMMAMSASRLSRITSETEAYDIVRIHVRYGR